MQGYIYIFTLLITCDLLVTIFNISIPGSILGLIILFTVFCIKKSIISSIEESASILLKYLPLFLVPLGVGIKELIVNADFMLAKMIAISILSLLCAIFITIFTIHILKKFSIKNEVGFNIKGVEK